MCAEHLQREVSMNKAGDCCFSRAWILFVWLVTGWAGLAGSLVAEDVRETLGKFEKGDPGWKVRMEGLVSLVKASPAVIPVLVDVLKNGPPSIRDFAAQVLAVDADPSTRPALVEALGNPDGGVSRIYAIKGLSMIDRLEPTQEPYRWILAEDPDWWVRRYLAWAVERDDSVTAAAAIRQALTDYDLSRIDTARLDELAPDFSLSDAFGKTYRLSDFRGKRAVILVFYDEGL